MRFTNEGPKIDGTNPLDIPAGSPVLVNFLRDLTEITTLGSSVIDF
jgi:hypothetical protein